MTTEEPRRRPPPPRFIAMPDALFQALIATAADARQRLTPPPKYPRMVGDRIDHGPAPLEETECPDH